MQILIIRHASAEERSAFAATGKSDDRRPLTDEGRRKMTEAAQGLRALVPHLDVIGAPGPATGRLHWLHTPAMLRRMAE